jgi:hypothetical protein
VICIEITSGSYFSAHVPPTEIVASSSANGGSVAWIVAVRRRIVEPVVGTVSVSVTVCDCSEPGNVA